MNIKACLKHEGEDYNHVNQKYFEDFHRLIFDILDEAYPPCLSSIPTSDGSNNRNRDTTAKRL